MTKADHIQYWTTSAEEDWNRAALLKNSRDFVFALFCVHLCIEKLAKALWVKENTGNHPARIHDVKYLLADTSFIPDADQSLFIDNLQRYQIEGRYPDYRRLIYSYTTEAYCTDLMQQADAFKQCLLAAISA